MKTNIPEVRKCLKSFDFNTLFREHLGWDNHQAQLEIRVDSTTVRLSAVAQKRGFVTYVCSGQIPDRATRLKIDHQITKSAREHLVIYADQIEGQQVWQWVRREPGKPLASRDHRFAIHQSGDSLIQRLDQIAVSLDEEEKITIVDMAGRNRKAFDVDNVTKKFFDRFKAEHATFLKFIKGIKIEAELQWYTSLMLNRLMFVYFIQKKGFLDGDLDYLRSRLSMVQQVKGKDRFQSFYRYFLLRLFHDGLGKSLEERKLDSTMEKLLGKVPYLNGGFFEVHQLEEQNPEIEIPDKAFEKLFDFFDQYSWHLDERPLRADNEINPDVVGYIFEKYINQKQMGAYYTKEDITEYISKNTIIPFLFDAAQKQCAVAFNADSSLWRLLRDNPDRYIYPAVRCGVIDEEGNIIPLPKDIEAGIKNVEKRNDWNRSATGQFALPTETWREHIARRLRCMDIREKLRNGEACQINDLITMNLDIWQFARDVIANAEEPELLRAFWCAIEKVTVLDPTCGSGAFLFAALRILETLYSDCLERMAHFIEGSANKPDHLKQYSDFRNVLALIAKHPNDRYFILKSIIINNLFGVDIMEEAVEICKLRLFLKLIAQVETVDQIEPLPDIDFNIRAGNTLVGYVSLNHVRNTIKNLPGHNLGLVFEKEEEQLRRIEEDAETVGQAFRQFREKQTSQDGNVAHKDKQKLRVRLATLDAELDRYLAGEYGVNADKQKEFNSWKASHEPFHWFVEFYGIMNHGGFDVIIGNPPYLERSRLGSIYTIRGFKTESCRDIYSWIMERTFHLRRSEGRLGLIVPVSIASSGSFDVLRDIVQAESHYLWLSHFANRPGQLFVGAQNRLTILLSVATGPNLETYSTRYHRWDARNGERDALFALMRYYPLNDLSRAFHGLYPKIGDPESAFILRKTRDATSLAYSLRKHSRNPVIWVRVPGYFCQFFLDPPVARPEKGGATRPRGELIYIHPEDESVQRVIHAILNSSTYFHFFYAYTDGRHINPSDVTEFPFDSRRLSKSTVKQLVDLSRRLAESMRENTSQWRKSGLLIDSVDSRPAKSIIDETDSVLAKHYGLTEAELDFIINYDIKYRMGADGDDRDEETT